MSGVRRSSGSDAASGSQPATKRLRESKRRTPDATLLDSALSGERLPNVKVFPGVDVRHVCTLQQRLIPHCAAAAISQQATTLDWCCVGEPQDSADQDSFTALPLLRFEQCNSTGGGDTCNIAPSGNTVVKAQVMEYDVKGSVYTPDVRWRMFCCAVLHLYNRC